jgi:hypothetical protein
MFATSPGFAEVGQIVHRFYSTVKVLFSALCTRVVDEEGGDLNDLMIWRILARVLKLQQCPGATGSWLWREQRRSRYFLAHLSHQSTTRWLPLWK